MFNVFDLEDEIVSIEYIGEEDTIDINVSNNRLFYANDLLTHNSAVSESEHDHSHIAGGISKINTADNVITIYINKQMREKGEYRLKFIKTRNSSSTGEEIVLGYDTNCLKLKNHIDNGKSVESVDLNDDNDIIKGSVLEKLKKKKQKKEGFDDFIDNV